MRIGGRMAAMIKNAPRNFRPGPFQYGEEIEIEIASLTNLGKGVGRIDDWVVFVGVTTPGDRVLARVWSNHANYSQADLVKVLRPAPGRTESRCPLFGECGGCQYQHMEYDVQLEWKQRQVAELLERMAGMTIEVQPVIPSPEIYGYRSKITPHFQKPKDGNVGSIGFLLVDRRQMLVDVANCPIAMPEINVALTELRAEVHREASSYRKGATLLLRASKNGVVSDQTAECREVVDGIEFVFAAGEFFQNNPYILPEFVRYVRDESSGNGARFLLDAYCGSGLFCLTAASAFEESVGVEISESAIAAAQANAERNGITNAKFFAGQAASVFPNYPHQGEQTALVIDPPRKGCDSEFLNQVFELRPSRVVYVSCNPATQIRDLKAFKKNGYELKKVQPFDLFPQTRHLECVMTLDSKVSG